MLFFRYNGSAHAIKVPTNAPGASVGKGGKPDLQSFLLWTLLPAGDVIVELDEAAYPYAISHIESFINSHPKESSNLPLWEKSSGPATIEAPTHHRPSLTKASF